MAESTNDSRGTNGKTTAEEPREGESREMLIADIKLDAKIYPRIRQDDSHVAACRLGIGRLPPITVTHENWLVDGYHRYLAHIAEGLQEIEAEVITLPKDDVLVEATRRNAKHGKQLSHADKKKLAVRLYSDLRHHHDSASETIKELAELLSVGIRTVRSWTTDLRQAENEARDERIWQLWLACKSTYEIAEMEGISQETARVATGNGLSAVSSCGSPPHLQLYDVWNFSKCAEEYGQANYPGRIPGQIVENLLWYYTEPGDVVLDPMAGGGTTIDVCKAMGRRYLAFDLQPVRPDVKQHNACEPLPLPASLTQAHVEVSLVFLDPPYWKQKRGKYAAGGLADQNLPEFYESLLVVIDNARQVLQSGGYVALIIGHTQEAEIIYDHAIDLLRRVDMALIRRFIVPYSTQQHGGAYVITARKNKYPLYLYRDLMVWRKE